MPAVKRKHDARTGPMSSKRTKIAQPRTTVAARNNRTELKVLNAVRLDQTLSGGNAFIGLFGVAEQGSSYNERDGKAIKHVDFDFSFKLATDQGVQSGAVRVILGVYRGRGLDEPEISNIIDGYVPGNAQNIMRHYEYENSKNVTILHDETYNLRPGANEGTDPVSTVLYKNLPTIKYSAVQEYWDETSGSYNNMIHFYLFVNGEEGPAVFQCAAQNRYIDI